MSRFSTKAASYTKIVVKCPLDNIYITKRARWKVIFSEILWLSYLEDAAPLIRDLKLTPSNVQMKVNVMRKIGPFRTVTRGSGCLRACWCIQWCTSAFVSWSGADPSCCSLAAGSRGAGGEPPPDSSSASFPSRWPSCVFLWTSWVCAASWNPPPVPWRQRGNLGFLGALWSSTSPGKSRRSPWRTLEMWTAATPDPLHSCCRGSSSQTWL